MLALEWWHWLVLGLILIALELAASGGFYVIFFGIAALAIGSLRVLDLAGPAWMQILLFILISVAALMFFRRPVLQWLQLDAPGPDVDSLVGDVAVAIDDIEPGAIGRAELRGTVWTARNRAAVALRKGQRCTVVSVDRLTIFIEPEGARP
jgi:membrane protein implicated in regulation of membrane protease activity